MKTLKKTLSIFLVLAMVLAFVPSALAADTPFGSPTATDYATSGLLADAVLLMDYADFFGYVENSGTAPTVTMESDPGTNGATLAILVIDFEKEIIYWKTSPGVPTEAEIPTHYSLDGTKWTAMKFTIGENEAAAIADGQKDFKKILDKGATKLQFTSAIDSKTKQPQKAVTANPATGTEGVVAATTYVFAKINARPKLDKFNVDYSKHAVLGDAGFWTLVNKGGTQKITDLQVAYSADKKTPAKGETDTKSGWGIFPTEDASPTVVAGAMPVKEPTTEGKVDKFTFLVRVAPTDKSAGSKVKKIAVSSLIKAPSLKVDYKKGILKTKAGTILTKSGMKVLTDDLGVIAENTTTNKPDCTPDPTAPLSTKAYTKEDKAVKEGLPIKEVPITGSTPDVTYTDASGISTIAGVYYTTNKTSDTNLYYGAGYAAYTVATEKKPASVAQNILIKKVTDVYELNAIPTVKGTSVKLPKGYEACLWADRAKPETKWKTSIKTDKNATYAVRVKNNAKFNAKTGNTSGDTQSGSLILDVATGKDAKGKTIVTAAAYLWTTKTGTISDTDKQTASAAKYAVYPLSAADTVKIFTMNHTNMLDEDAEDYEDKKIEVPVIVVGDGNSAVATAGATAPTLTSGKLDASLKIEYEIDADAIKEDTEFVVDFKAATGKDDEFYAPTFKYNVEVDNKSFVDPVVTFLKGLTKDDLTVANASGNNVQATVETAFKTKITDAEDSDAPEISTLLTTIGGTVTYTFTEFKAPTGTGTAGATADGCGELKCEATVKRGDYEVVVPLTVPPFFLDT